MKNIAVLMLKSDAEGAVVGDLSIFFKFSLKSVGPAAVNEALREHNVKKLVLMGAESGTECDFPLELGGLMSFLSLTEGTEQSRFVCRLNCKYPITFSADNKLSLGADTVLET